MKGPDLRGCTVFLSLDAEERAELYNLSLNSSVTKTSG